MRSIDNSPVFIEAPARLHLGFMDLEGGLGRRFGSIGLTLDGVATKIVVHKAEHIEVKGDPSGRIQKKAEDYFIHKGLTGGCHIEVIEQILGHSGLGSGTQLALAVGKAIAVLYNVEHELSELATVLKRGARSGIGIGAFQQGGFLVDGGRDTYCAAPPIISRMQFPSSWRVLLIFDVHCRGLHGQDENASFNVLPNFSAQTAAYLCRLVMMQILPAISEENINAFSQGIHEVQLCLGEFFASVQGGRYTSTSVGDAIAYLESLEVQGVGQSSWGPTGFAFVNSETQAHILLQELQTKFDNNKELQFKVVSARNTGAVIQRRDVVSLPKAIQS